MKPYTLHYIALALIFGTGVFALYFFQEDLLIEQIVIWMLAGAYLIWGIVHHMLKKDLTSTIVLEYILISILAGAIVNTLLI